LIFSLSACACWKGVCVGVGVVGVTVASTGAGVATGAGVVIGVTGVACLLAILASL